MTADSISKSCFTCKHSHSHKETESWEMSHIFWWEHSCDVRPSIGNLKNFPFRTTDCKQWENVNDLT